MAIKRIESDYYGDFDDTRTIQSATAVRTRLINEEPVETSMPTHVLDSLEGLQLNTLRRYDSVIRYLLAIHNKKTLGNIFSFEEGLENWMLKHRDAPGHDALVKAMATRRYTQARIKRSIMHMMLATTKQDAPDFTIPYIRILGMTSHGQTYLNKIKNHLNVDLITKIGRERPPLLDFELRTSRLYAFSSDPAVYEQEFDPVIIL
jgi:predicted nucleotidyltransferase